GPHKLQSALSADIFCIYQHALLQFLCQAEWLDSTLGARSSQQLASTCHGCALLATGCALLINPFGSRHRGAGGWIMHDAAQASREGGPPALVDARRHASLTPLWSQYRAMLTLAS